jgi:uncharacterized protein
LQRFLPRDRSRGAFITDDREQQIPIRHDITMFDDCSFSLEDFSGRARLFPLPNLVLFPHVMQPLHIFEPRYRALLEDAINDDGLIAMAVLAPGWEKDYEGRPKIHPMTCLGRITTHVRLADGTYNVLLLGLQRARLINEAPPVRAYREADVALCKDQYPIALAERPLILRERLREALLNVLPTLPEAQEQLDQLLGNDVPLGVLADVVAYMLDLEVGCKQALLGELDVYRRTELLLGALPTAKPAETTGRAVFFPPEFSEN